MWCQAHVWGEDELLPLLVREEGEGFPTSSQLRGDVVHEVCRRMFQAEGTAGAKALGLETSQHI